MPKASRLFGQRSRTRLTARSSDAKNPIFASHATSVAMALTIADQSTPRMRSTVIILIMLLSASRLKLYFFIGVRESEVNEFMIIGLGMGVLSMAFLAAILICHRKRKRKNHVEHPMLPSHAHFHTCESIGERFATSSSMDSVKFIEG